MGILRRTAELLLRNSSFTRRLPSTFGRARIVASADAALSFLKPGTAAFADDLLLVARNYVKPGDVVWDVGANVGVFSVAAAMRAGTTGRVVAFEPDQFLTSLLTRTSELKEPGRAPLDVVPVAVSGINGIARFQIAGRGRASNSLVGAGRSQSGGTRAVRIVPTVTLDSMQEHFPPPNLLKIDVEGAEMDVLRGAEALLAGTVSAVFIEVGRESWSQCTSILRRHGFRLFSVASGEPFEIEECEFNTLALRTRENRKNS